LLTVFLDHNWISFIGMAAIIYVGKGYISMFYIG